jgi:selenocysteine lyase/cysteine desulfurase
VDSEAAFDYLYGEHGFVFRPFHTQGLNTVRISPNIYNGDEEIARFFDALGKMPSG